MKFVTTGMVLSLLLLWSPPAPAQTCAATNDAAEAACLKISLQQTETKLTQAFAELDGPSGLLPRDKPLLRKAQKVWREHRSLDCELQSRSGLDALDRTLRRYRCLNTYNEARVEALENLGHLFGS